MLPTSPYLDIAPEVAAALRDGRPLVALESTIISHGMPYPKNAETALRLEQAVRDHGATPATIAILSGRLKLGISKFEIKYLGEQGRNIIKCSRRDIPFLAARKLDGATTVAATMLIASLAGIRLIATGGIGGVHRGAEDSLDISADLEELGRTSVGVVCSGVKSVLDIGRTLEYLETLGVPVVGYQTDRLPAFYTRDSAYPVDYRCDSAADVANALNTKWALGIQGGVVIANPVPEEFSMDAASINRVIDRALIEMNELGITGKETTPYLLAKIAETTHGESLETNIELVLNNARLAALIATHL